MLRRIRLYHDKFSTIISPYDPHSPPEPPSVDIAYRVIGNGPENLVFIAGMCVSHTMWHHQVKALSASGKYTLILIDNRDTGLSVSPRDDEHHAHHHQSHKLWTSASAGKAAQYDITTLARDVWAVVDAALGSHAQVHLIGHSMGSMIAQRAALLCTKPSRLSSLTLLCGHDGGWFWNNMPPSLALLGVLARIAFSSTVSDVRGVAHGHVQLHFSARYLRQHGERLGRRYERGIRRGMRCASVFQRHLAAVRTHSLSGAEARQLRGMRECARAVVYGAEDTVVLPRASRQLAARIGAPAFGLRAAHFAIEEAAGDVNELIEWQVERAVGMRAGEAGRAKRPCAPGGAVCCRLGGGLDVRLGHKSAVGLGIAHDIAWSATPCTGEKFAVRG